MSHEFEYVQKLSPSPEKAERIQALVLQDLIKGEFDKPTDLADPHNPDLVARQYERLKSNPNVYSGHVDEFGEPVSMMKLNRWNLPDEIPFMTSEFQKRVATLKSKLGKTDMKPTSCGIFGLVVHEELDADTRDIMLDELVRNAVAQSLAHSAVLLNVITYDKDPLYPIIHDHGFMQVGSQGVAAGAPRRLQQRYQKNVAA